MAKRGVVAGIVIGGLLVLGCRGSTAERETTAPDIVEQGVVGGPAADGDDAATGCEAPPVETDPISCEGGYCEPDNQASATVCRAGFHVEVYRLCGPDAAACCMRDR